MISCSIDRVITLTNETSMINIEGEYLLLTEKVKEFMLLHHPQEHLRLMGSVPRGNAIAGLPDIDFLLITNETLKNEEKSRIQQLKKELAEAHPIVFRVDITLMTHQDLENDPAYLLIVQTDSLSLSGDDKYTKKEVKLTASELNSLWNLKPNHFIPAMKDNLINREFTEKELLNYSCLTGKDSLKCFRQVLISREGVADRNIEDLWKNLVRFIPEKKDFFNTL